MSSMLFLYIDPSTGSAIFSIVISLFTILFFAMKNLVVKLKYNLKFTNVKVNAVDKENIIIFSDSKRYINVFKPILDEFENRKVNVKYLTLDDDDPLLENKYKYINCDYLGKSNIAYSRLNTLNANIVLATTPSLDVYQWKKSKNVNKYIHILHEVGGATEYKLFGLDFFDTILLSGDFQINQIRNIEGNRHIKEKELVVVGSPCMDYLQEKVDKNKNKNTGKKTILVGPTWGKSSLLNVYGEKLLDALLDTGYNIVLRPHPQSKSSEKELLDRLMDKYKDNSRIVWNFDNDNFDALNNSDVLISDYSGVILEYAFCFKKPIIYNISIVDNSPLDCYYQTIPLWRYNAYTKLGKELNEDRFANMKDFIDQTIENNEDMEDMIDMLSNEAWKYKGQGAKNVCDFILHSK